MASVPAHNDGWSAGRLNTGSRPVVGLDNKPPAADQTAVSSFTELSERFSALLLESAELFAPVSLDELASGAGTDESADEVLRAALASLGMDADYYAAEQTLVGLTVE